MSFNPFTLLSATQKNQLDTYQRLLFETNQVINLVSRQMAWEDYAERNLLHALALTYKAFPAGSEVVDWGTGGGLPGLPLAICFPEVQFHLVDATTKKIQAVRRMADELGLENVTVYPIRAETFQVPVHFAISRATAPLHHLLQWFKPVAQPFERPKDKAYWKQGVICLKGGDLKTELLEAKRKFPRLKLQTWDLATLLERPYFNEKLILEAALG